MRERITIFLLIPVFIGLTVSLGFAEEFLQAFSWKCSPRAGCPGPSLKVTFRCV